MKRIVDVLPEASAEMEAEIAYYRHQAGEHVADNFVDRVLDVLNGLREGRFIGAPHPHVRPARPIRRVFVERFPYAVVYYTDGETVTIVAVEALRRKPGYWRSRLD